MLLSIDLRQGFSLNPELIIWLDGMGAQQALRIHPCVPANAEVTGMPGHPLTLWILETHTPVLTLAEQALFLIVLAGFISISHKLESSRRREPQWRKCLHKIRLWGIFLIGNDGRAQPNVGDATPGDGGLEFQNKAG